jgi:hypothetical protein
LRLITRLTLLMTILLAARLASAQLPSFDFTKA